MEQPLNQKNLPVSIEPYTVLGKDDPLLQELWAIKAEINKAAHYSVQQRRRQVEGLTLSNAMEPLAASRS
jgi:hypothetical protein